MGAGPISLSTEWRQKVEQRPSVELKCKLNHESSSASIKDNVQTLNCVGVELLQGDMVDFADYAGIRVTIKEK